MNEKKPLDGNVWRDNLKDALDLINSSESFLFSGDIDPDSVGSMLSLSLYLHQLDKKVYLILPEYLGENLDFFEKIIEYNAITILRNKDQIESVKNDIETIIFCDTANTKLVPHYSFIAEKILTRKPKVIEIDHHFGADSEELTDYGIKLFRKANANTEIIGKILLTYHEKYHEGPNPFDQRNIILGLITGMLGDTVGGKVIPYKEDYDDWMDLLQDRLKSITRWRESDPDRGPDDKESKFGDPKQILAYLNRLTEEQEACFNLLNSRVELKGKIGFLNLFPSTQEEVKNTCKPFDSDWFADIQNFLLNSVPEKSGCAGMVVFEGQNADGEDCFFIKIRRAVKFQGIDLRTAEEKLKGLFGDLYMGGGGHAGAVSFRIHTMDEKEFLEKIETIFEFFNQSLMAASDK
ncbi:MAG: DHH family phosphoesterase [Nitrospinota bacterium]